MARTEQTLRAWTFADELVIEVFAITRRVEGQATTELASLLRGAAVRGAIRIVQGLHGRPGDLDTCVSAALASLSELRYYVYLARRLGAIDLRQYRSVCASHERVMKALREARVENPNLPGRATRPPERAPFPAAPDPPGPGLALGAEPDPG